MSVNEHGSEAMQIQEQKQHPRKRPGFESPLNPPPQKKLIEPIFWSLFSLLLDLVIYCANVWNEREADNVRERRDFEEDEVKSHIRLSSAQPFNWKVFGTTAELILITT